MKYRNAGELLPKELLAELQRYAEGELIYVPNRPKRKAGWGTRNGSRERYEERNRQLMRQYSEGMSVEAISEQYYLTADSVRKIIRENTNKAQMG